MSIIKGYYNVNNGIFLGPMTATNEATGVASTPRYIEGVCFGEYNTQTEEFVPHTNPMHIPKGMIYTQDEQINDDGNLVNIRSGIEEDKGADFVSKNYVPMALNRTPNVETRDPSGKIYPDRPASSPVKQEVNKEPSPTRPIVEAKESRTLSKDELLGDIDFDNLF